MRTPSIMAVLVCCGVIATATSAREPMPVAPPSSDTQANTDAAIDLRPIMARMQLKKGRNAIYTDGQGGTLEAVVDRRGAITGYALVDAKGKVSKLEERTGLSVVLKPGKPVVVHKCFVIAKECLDNPLPRSGNPEDCAVEIPCPNTGSFSNLLSR